MTSINKVGAGQALPVCTIEVTRERLVEYAAASGDRNRIHWDEVFAREVGLPDVIAHGMFTMSAAVEAVSAWAGDPGAVVEYSTRFTKPVVVPYGQVVQVRVAGVVKKVDVQAGRATITLTVTCGDDQVLGKATAVVALP